MQRRRFRQDRSLHDRLAEWANQIRDQAASLPPGPERDTLLEKVRQARAAIQLDNWAGSSKLQSQE